jgi:hypothetical protein
VVVPNLDYLLLIAFLSCQHWPAAELIQLINYTAQLAYVAICIIFSQLWDTIDLKKETCIWEEKRKRDFCRSTAFIT